MGEMGAGVVTYRARRADVRRARAHTSVCVDDEDEDVSFYEYSRVSAH